MKVTISEAAKLAGISRQHMYRAYITPGKLSVTKEQDKSFIDMSELLRVFPNVTMATDNGDKILQVETHKIDNVTGDGSELVTLLKHQLAEAKEREEWLKVQIDDLRQMQGRLLEDKTPKTTIEVAPVNEPVKPQKKRWFSFKKTKPKVPQGAEA